MHIWFWIAFNAVILLLLVLDLTVVSRKHRTVPFKQALLMSAFWIGLAMAFAVFVHQWLGVTKSLEFLTGYVLEEALSVDNLFVFILLFAYFKVPPEEEKTCCFGGLSARWSCAGFLLESVWRWCSASTGFSMPSAFS